MKSAENVIEAIGNAKRPPLARFIHALGIRHVGEHLAEVLAGEFGGVEALARADAEALVSVHEVGPQVADRIVRFFSDERSRKMVDDLISAGVEPVAPAPLAEADPGEAACSGLAFVLTGTLSGKSRSGAKAAIEALGGRVSASVRRNTSYLVAGENPGAKARNAESLGVPILDEAGFEEMLARKKRP